VSFNRAKKRPKPFFYNRSVLKLFSIKFRASSKLCTFLSPINLSHAGSLTNSKIKLASDISNSRICNLFVSSIIIIKTTLFYGKDIGFVKRLKDSSHKIPKK
jgi:hypothetical protein